MPAMISPAAIGAAKKVRIAQSIVSSYFPVSCFNAVTIRLTLYSKS